ncbi:MAG: PaREP1 family protein, partial [Thermoproteus sp.]
MAITISPPVADVLKKAAGGRELEEFLLELVAERLDPPQHVEAYLAL